MGAALKPGGEAFVPSEDSLLSHPLFGGGLPPLAEEHLHEAGLNYQFGDVAEDHLRRAEKIAPDHFAVLIASIASIFTRGGCDEALGRGARLPRQGGARKEHCRGLARHAR